MNTARINNKGQARIFDNPYLEMLSKTKPWIIYALYIPMNAFLVYYAWTKLHFWPGLIAMLFLTGMLSWTLFEYLVHCFLFHFRATSAIGRRLVYIFHENHHEFPRDKSRLFMPPLPSVVMAGLVLLLFCGISYLITGAMGAALVFFSGFITGYLIYVSIHFAIHAYRPPRYLKILWRNHHLHHYKNPDKAFGVSSLLWDKVFGTLPDSTK